MKIFLCFLLVHLLLDGYSQERAVVVKKDPRIDVLVRKRLELMKKSKPKAFSTTRRGFRLQVYNAQNRDEANGVKAELLRRFPGEKAYLIYQAPNFRVRFGNFLTQRDANNMRKTIAALFPGKSIFIIPDRIEYIPPPEEED